VIAWAARAAQRALWIPVGYLAAVTIAALRYSPPRPAPSEETRFVVLVPAHDEEASVAETVSSLLAAEYPAERRRVVVVADNCTDETADRASTAGADVWARDDVDAPGKGPALRWAIDRLLDEEDWDAAVLVDADTVVDPGFLGALAARLHDGAEVLQAEYRVANPDESVVTRLAQISFAIQSGLRQRGRAALGGAAKLQGNGMAFRRSVLARHGWLGEGAVEDIDMWLRLLERGVRPQFAPDAIVAGLMPETAEAARVQRGRWESGRSELARERLVPAVETAIRRRDPVLLEAAVTTLAFPPLTTLAALVAGVGAARWTATGRVGSAPAQLAVLGTHAVAALAVTKAPRSSYALLALAPAVVGWKLAVKLGSGRPQGWQRTPR
jgi:1,2-diacylglycerol 3-beta-glucosyltransferase